MRTLYKDLLLVISEYEGTIHFFRGRPGNTVGFYVDLETLKKALKELDKEPAIDGEVVPDCPNCMTIEAVQKIKSGTELDPGDEYGCHLCGLRF